LPLWKGAVFFNSKKISGLTTSALIKEGLVYISQKNNYFENLTTIENLQVSGSTYSNMEVKERIEGVYQNIDKLKEFEFRTPFNMSGGERQLLALGNALMHRPKLIMFDEPFAGLDNKNKEIIISEILRLKKVDKIAFLIVEHIRSFPENFFNRNIHVTLGKIT